MNDVIARQLQLEDEMRALGRTALLRSVQAAKDAGRESGTPYGHRLLQEMIRPIAEGLREYLDKAGSANPTRRPQAYPILSQFDPDVVAFKTLRVVIDALTGANRKRSLQRDAILIATALEDEAMAAAFEAEAPTEFKLTTKKISKSGHQGYRSRVLRLMANRRDVPFEEWSHRTKLLVGLALIDIIKEKTDMIRLEEIAKPGRQKRRSFETIYQIVATESTLKWIEAHTEHLADLATTWMPMVCPPVEWDGVEPGGYLSAVLRRRTPLVKSHNKGYLEEVRNTPMPTVYAAVNAIQATAWRVNTKVLTVAKAMWEGDRGTAGLPMREAVAEPPKPADIETNPEAKRAWKKTAGIVRGTNIKLGSKRMAFSRLLWVAEKFAAEPALYFPVQLDFRGRVYYMPTGLNPQGDDVTKAMLTFAEGKPINDERAAGWLAIHGANCWGEDKLPLDSRVGWVADNEDRILAVAADPTGNLWWTEADSPWLFLAFCFEWAALQEHGYGYVSSLPIHVDGSCNGLQHFAAMLRDHVGGEAVNLVPAEKPADVYQRVADRLTELLLKEHKKGDEWAGLWLNFGIDRKITKRPVMTLPYGVSMWSSRDYVEQAVREKVQGGQENLFRQSPEDDGIFKAASAVLPHLWKAIGDVVVSARGAMGWLRKLASLASAEGLPVNWYAPSGFPVQQAYKSMEGLVIGTKLDGKRIQLRLVGDGIKVDRRKQAQGISPNFVHSLDAAHLMLYVEQAVENGMTHFSVIHDSYGTVAADADTMSACLRDAFVTMYEEHDVLQELLDACRPILPPKMATKLPGAPRRGSLSLAQVRDSDFCFA